MRFPLLRRSAFEESVPQLRVIDGLVKDVRAINQWRKVICKIIEGSDVGTNDLIAAARNARYIGALFDRRRFRIEVWRQAIRKVVEDSYVDLYEIARRLEGQTRDAFMAAIEQIKNTISMADLKAALESGNMKKVESIVNIDGLADELDTKTSLLHKAFHEAAAVAVSTLSDELGMSFAFDKTDANAVRWIEQYGAQKVVEIVDSTKAGLRATLQAAELEGYTVPQTARFIREQIGLTEALSNAVQNQYAGDLADGVDPDVALARSQRYYEKLLNYRSKNIARTELADAAMGGQLEGWKQAEKQGYLDKERTERIWLTTVGACPEICAPMDHQTVAFDEPFETGDGREIWKPGSEAHPSCRCSVRLKIKR